MGRIFKAYIEAPSIYVCNDCSTHVVSSDNIISKQFHGRHGKAYLFDDVVNISLGPTEERMLLTGIHQVADVYCNGCDKALGWKYKHATEPSQKYKEGKYIVEKAMVKKTVS